MKTNPAADTIFTPSEASALTVQLIEERRDNPDLGVPTFIRPLDLYMRPAQAGELMVVIGRTGNYKSGFLQYIARSFARHLQEIGDPRCVVFITWEMAIEDVTLFELAFHTGDDAGLLARGHVRDHDRLVMSAMQRSTLPLWLMGHSIARRRRRPRLSMSDVEQGLYFAEDEWGLRPALIVLDYIQRIRSEGGHDRRLYTAEITERAKDLGLAMGCPVWAGSQARREVTSRRMKLPMPEDAKEAGDIEETADGIVTLMLPKSGEIIGSLLPTCYPVQENIIVSEDLLLVCAAKRRLNAAGQVFPLRVDYAHNLIREYD